MKMKCGTWTLPKRQKLRRDFEHFQIRSSVRFGPSSSIVLNPSIVPTDHVMALQRLGSMSSVLVTC